MDFKNYKLSYVKLTFVIAFFYAVVVNLPLYSALNEIFKNLDVVSVGFAVSIPIFILAALNFLFNIFSWPYITKPFFITLIILSAAVSYAGFNYGTLFDSDMITNIIETDSSEASSYISTYSMLWMLGMGVAPAILLLVIPIKKIDNVLKFAGKKLLSMIMSIIVIILIAIFYYQDYASVGRNNSYLRQLIVPTQLVYSIGKYVNHKYMSEPLVYKEIGLDARQSPKSLASAQNKPTLLVFVLGETARAKNYQLNEYERETNKYTKTHDVISFQNVTSCGTATAVSVPCMFSALERNNYNRNRADNQDNWLDIMKRAGIDLFWIENDGGDKDVAKNIKKIEVDRRRVDDMCNGKTCFDLATLENFESNIENMQGNRMLLLHFIGSHGPTYFQRYPEESRFFEPDCARADIENCSVEEIVNTYDNTILYTDYVISEAIGKLKKLSDEYNTALFYISDHGESLGENGIFLHGLPYSLAPREQIHIPMIFWMSEGFKREKSINRKCIEVIAKEKKYSQDNLFHSMLGIMDVETTVYNPVMDIFEQCRN